MCLANSFYSATSRKLSRKSRRLDGDVGATNYEIRRIPIENIFMESKPVSLFNWTMFKRFNCSQLTRNDIAVWDLLDWKGSATEMNNVSNNYFSHKLGVISSLKATGWQILNDNP